MLGQLALYLLAVEVDLRYLMKNGLVGQALDGAAGAVLNGRAEAHLRDELLELGLGTAEASEIVPHLGIEIQKIKDYHRRKRTITAEWIRLQREGVITWKGNGLVRDVCAWDFDGLNKIFLFKLGFLSTLILSISKNDRKTAL